MLQAEFMKLKRKWVILFTLLCATVPPLINVAYTLNLPKGSKINAKFTDFYQFTFTEWVLLPCVLGMIGAMIIFDERENGTLKQLMIIPVRKTLFLFSKFAIVFIFSILFMLINAVFTMIGAFIVGYSDITKALVLRLFLLCVQTGFLTAFAMLPIFLIAVIVKEGYIMPACVSLIYAISGLILSSNLSGIHPLCSVAGIVWYRSIEGTGINANLTSCILDIIVISAVSVAAAIWALKTQDY